MKLINKNKKKYKYFYPYPNPIKLKKFYTEKYFSTSKNYNYKYQKFEKDFFKNYPNLIIEFLKLILKKNLKKLNLIDIGCGNGSFINSASRHFKTVVGVDFSKKNLSYKLNFVRGNTLSFGFSYQFGLGKKNTQLKYKKKQQKILNSKAIQIVTSKSESNLYKAGLKYLNDENFYLQHANLQNDKLEIVLSQSQFRNPAISSGRAFNILNQIAPADIRSFKISEINGGIGIYSAEIDRDAFKELKNSLFLLTLIEI